MKRSLRYVIVGVLVYVLGLSVSFAGYAQDIRDVKPPVVFPTHWVALLIVLLTVVLAGAGYFLYHKCQRQRTQTAATSIRKTPWERAYERLDDLLKNGLLARGEWEQYYLALSDIVRRYFEERFNVRAPEMTSEEFLISLRNFGGLAAESKMLLEEFLIVCDMVKFARHAPDAAVGQKNAALARRLIDETKGESPGTAGNPLGRAV